MVYCVYSLDFDQSEGFFRFTMMFTFIFCKQIRDQQTWYNNFSTFSVVFQTLRKNYRNIERKPVFVRIDHNYFFVISNMILET